jgi:glycine dehydrogenase subunit 2
VVEEAMMVEPTETESKETLDAFAAALLRAAEEAESDPTVLKEAPVTTPVRRLDEAKAARSLRLRWEQPPLKAPPDMRAAGEEQGRLPTV